MDNLKKYYNIEKEITLQSKVENDHLFVFYKDQWIQLSYKKKPRQILQQSNTSKSIRQQFVY